METKKQDNCKACAMANQATLTQQPHSHEHNDTEIRQLWRIIMVSSALLIASLLIDHTVADWWGMPWLRPVAYLLAFLPTGLPVLKEAWELTVEHRDFFNENTLMTIAAIGAFGIREYPEAVMLMILYNIGEVLQAKAVTHAKRSISDLVDVRTEEVLRLLPEGGEELIPAAEAEPGDHLRARVGDRLSLDGKLTSAHASLDLSALTGESMPVALVRGERVLAGSVVQGHPIELVVEKPYEESTLARILEMSEEAAERKPETERFIRRFARVYTPIVMGLALLVVLVPWIVSLVSPNFTYIFSDWFYRSLVFLVTSCPCALIISVPLTYFSGLGSASKHGLLFKGAIFLEKLRTATSVVFDKTGTITEGRFEVTSVATHSALPAEEALALLAAVEAQSSHPMAQAILSHTDTLELPEVSVVNVRELAGFGLQAEDWQGRRLLVGNERLMLEQGLEMPSTSSATSSVVHLAVGDEVVLTVELQDLVKPTSQVTVSQLHKRGLSPIVILSGDKPEVVTQVAEEVGVDRAYGGLLPQDKMRHVEALMQEEEHEVVFVGDGLNDAPVMSLTGIGVAMGGIASDATIEAADIVIQGNAPYKLVQAWDLSIFTHKIVNQNIVFSLGFKFIVMLLAIFGIASLSLAVIADVGVTLLTVVNATRVLRFSAKEPIKL